MKSEDRDEENRTAGGEGVKGMRRRERIGRQGNKGRLQWRRKRRKENEKPRKGERWMKSQRIRRGMGGGERDRNRTAEGKRKTLKKVGRQI